jgi:hypothetical protein
VSPEHRQPSVPRDRLLLPDIVRPGQVKGQLPTLDVPAPLSPDFLADLVRPPVPPALVDALVEGLVDAVLAEMETPT